MTNTIKYESIFLKIHQSCSTRKWRIVQKNERSRQKSHRNDIKNHIKFYDDTVFPMRKSY
jgi:hypothetical protein